MSEGTSGKVPENLPEKMLEEVLGWQKLCQTSCQYVRNNARKLARKDVRTSFGKFGSHKTVSLGRLWVRATGLGSEGRVLWTCDVYAFVNGIFRDPQ